MIASRRYYPVAMFFAACALAVTLNSIAAAAETSWPEAMLAARAACIEKIAQTPVSAGPWYATKPIKVGGFSEAGFPESGVDLSAKDEKGKALWEPQEGWADGAVHELRAYNSVSTYLYRTLAAGAACQLEVGLGSDDGIEVWLNGQKVHSNDVGRVTSPGEDRITLNLKQGDNALLLKIHNRTGGHAFYYAADNKPVAAARQPVEAAYPAQMAALKGDVSDDALSAWFENDGNVDLEKRIIEAALAEIGEAGDALRKEYDALCQGNTPPNDPRWLALYAEPIELRGQLRAARAAFAKLDLEALRLAVTDLVESFGADYPSGAEYLKRIDACAKALPGIEKALNAGDVSGAAMLDEILALRREALLANPLIDFDKLLVIKRKADRLGLPQNWQGNCSLPRSGYDNEIAVLSPLAGQGSLTTLYKPENPVQVADVDLHHDADKMLFSMLGSHGRWQIWEIGADGSGLRQVTPGEYPDVDNYDACYLPNGKIIFDSTAVFQGIPCVTGSDAVANLFVMDADGTNMRQLCFDQDHDWCPTVLNNGRVMYTRWEYSDTPHYFTRILFSMNPDGTNQMEYYGSNSMWPNSIFYARPIPGHPTKLVAIVSGHHGVPRMGELVIFDPAKGRHEADGVVQRIPGRGQKVEPVIVDQLVDNSWPKFLHPYPLNEKYFIVSCQPTPSSNWGIYLTDVFDNLTPIYEVPGYALFEPVPLRKTTPAPVVPDKVKPDLDEAVVYLADVYRGNGLKDVPRGTIKQLRLYEFHYAYPNMGGHVNIAMEGCWDVHRILGTVPVLEDGSAVFKVPANMPIAVQPLDGEGKAVQVMRSWFTAMPGEVLSCVGCHESQNQGPPSKPTLASRTVPAQITPWRGPARGFSFKRDVQPTLDKHCVGCHDGKPGRPDFARKDKNGWNNFTESYLALHPYVRRPGPESDYHLQNPYEWHADTSELVQMLKKGHKGVKLDDEAWDRLVTWIDLNVPDHGTWAEHREIPGDGHKRRMEMRTRYAGRPEDPEAIPALEGQNVEYARPEPAPARQPGDTECAGWPFSADDARKRRDAVGLAKEKTLDLGNGVVLNLTLVPAGEFIMGDQTGDLDESPAKRVAIDKPFYMGSLEITNAQYAAFDPEHDTGYIDQNTKDHTTRGYPANEPGMPVARVSWTDAVEFCKWLSEKAGTQFALPTEAQWEWACRAGTSTPFFHGENGGDFSRFANVADLSTKRLAVAGINPQPIENPDDYMAFLPRDNQFDDGERIVTVAGKYEPNVWGLHDMHGNVAEWTLSDYASYPYVDGDGRNGMSTDNEKVVRGGSWHDRPNRARSSFRLPYRPYQRVFNVGFRVVCPAE